jgi:hypothetical protein
MNPAPGENDFSAAGPTDVGVPSEASPQTDESCPSLSKSLSKSVSKSVSNSKSNRVTTDPDPDFDFDLDALSQLDAPFET